MCFQDEDHASTSWGTCGIEALRASVLYKESAKMSGRFSRWRESMFSKIRSTVQQSRTLNLTMRAPFSDCMGTLYSTPFPTRESRLAVAIIEEPWFDWLTSQGRIWYNKRRALGREI